MADDAKPGKSLGQKIGIGCLAIIGIFLGLAVLGAIIGPPADSEGTTASNDEQALVSAEADQSEQPEAPETKWSYSEQKDELRDSTNYYAEIQSENTVNFAFPYSGEQHLTLTVRKSAAFGEDVIFAIEEGQFICDVYECTGTIGFDGKVEPLTLVPPEDHDSTVLFAKYAGPIIRKLKSADRVVVELQFYQEGNRQFTFDTKGLKWDH